MLKARARPELSVRTDNTDMAGSGYLLFGKETVLGLKPLEEKDVLGHETPYTLQTVRHVQGLHTQFMHEFWVIFLNLPSKFATRIRAQFFYRT